MAYDSLIGLVVCNADVNPAGRLVARQTSNRMTLGSSMSAPGEEMRKARGTDFLVARHERLVQRLAILESDFQDLFQESAAYVQILLRWTASAGSSMGLTGDRAMYHIVILVADHKVNVAAPRVATTVRA